MARMVSSRPRRREGRGLGETLSESFVFIIIFAGLIAGGYWYFAVYRKSPQVALQNFVSAINSGNVEAEYNLLAASSKQVMGSQSNFKKTWPNSYGMSATVTSFVVNNAVLSGDSFTADVTMNVRKSTESLVQVASDTYTDHYVLTKEPDGWKVVLEKSKLDTSHARTPSSYGMAMPGENHYVQFVPPVMRNTIQSAAFRGA